MPSTLPDVLPGHACAPCPVGNPHCRGLIHHRDCENVASGVAGYPEMLRRLAGVPDVRHWPPPDSRVVIRTFLNDWSGFGRFGVGLGRGLVANGIDVAYEALSFDEDYRPVSDFQRSRVVTDPPDRWRLQMHFAGPVQPDRATVLLTMQETSGLRLGWNEVLNQCRAVIVPSRWNAQVIRDSGVRVPVYVVPGGVSAEEGFTPRLEPLPPAPFRVGMAARLAMGGCRKGIEDGFRAFEAAFPAAEYPDVRCEFKSWPDCLKYLRYRPVDPRITLNTEPMTTHEMAEWYRRQHVLLVPSRGEGWGLCTNESMCCGVPVIAALATATADFVDESCSYPLEYREEPATDYYEGHGNWYVPTQESMVEQLRRAYRDRRELAAKGRAAAGRGAEFSWCRAGWELRRVLIEVGMLVKPRGSLEDAVALSSPHR